MCKEINFLSFPYKQAWESPALYNNDLKDLILIRIMLNLLTVSHLFFRNELRKALESAIVRTNYSGSRIWSQFWSCHQRFFKHLWSVWMINHHLPPWKLFFEISHYSDSCYFIKLPSPSWQVMQCFNHI